MGVGGAGFGRGTKAERVGKEWEGSCKNSNMLEIKS